MGKSVAPRRTRLSPIERRDALLSAADALFRSQPYDEISMGDIARAAGVSHGLVYHYFPNKRAVRTANFEREAKRLEAALAPNNALEPQERSWAAIDNFVRYAETNTEGLVETARADSVTDPELKALADRVRGSVIDGIVAELGLRTASPVLRLSLVAWFASAERAAIEWVAGVGVERDVLVRLLVLSLRSALADALSIAPEDDLEPVMRQLIFGDIEARYGGDDTGAS